MPALARHGDPCGGSILATARTVRVNNKLIARVGDPVSAHGRFPHNFTHMFDGSRTVFAEGIAVCRVGDRAGCGHRVTRGSGDSNA